MKICEDNGGIKAETLIYAVWKDVRLRTLDETYQAKSNEKIAEIEAENIKLTQSIKEKDSEKGVRNELSPTPFKSFCRMICGKITTDYASRIFLMMSSTVSLYLVSCFMFLTTCPVA